MLQLSLGHSLGILAIQAMFYDWHWGAQWWFDPATVNQTKSTLNLPRPLGPTVGVEALPPKEILLPNQEAHKLSGTKQCGAPPKLAGL